MGIVFVNNASSLSQAPVAALDTSVTVDAADADKFPVLGVGDFVYLALEDRREVPNLLEIVKCTGRSGAVLTIVRAADGTAAQDFFIGSIVSARLCRAALLDFINGVTDAVEIALAAETAARMAADTVEAAARDNADVSIYTYVNAHVAGSVAAEAAARASVDAALQTQRNNDINYINAQDLAYYNSAVSQISPAVSSAVAAEAAARASVDNSLQTQINNLLAWVNSQDNSIITVLSNEITARISQYYNGQSSRAGTVTGNGAGAFSVTFSPAFPAGCAFANITPDGVVTGVVSEVRSASGYSGVMVDAANNPVPSWPVWWYAIGV